MGGWSGQCSRFRDDGSWQDPRRKVAREGRQDGTGREGSRIRSGVDEETTGFAKREDGNEGLPLLLLLLHAAGPFQMGWSREIS